MLEHYSHIRIAANPGGGRIPVDEAEIGKDRSCPLQFPLPWISPDGFSNSQTTDLFGRRGWTRTSDPQLRRLMLYPPELRARAAQNHHRVQV